MFHSVSWKCLCAPQTCATQYSRPRLTSRLALHREKHSCRWHEHVPRVTRVPGAPAASRFLTVDTCTRGQCGHQLSAHLDLRAGGPAAIGRPLPLRSVPSGVSPPPHPATSSECCSLSPWTVTPASPLLWSRLLQGALDHLARPSRPSSGRQSVSVPPSGFEVPQH